MMVITDESRKNELIHELHKVKFCSVPTVGTFDMGLQYDFISSEGAGTGLGNMLSWPAYKIRRIEDHKWQDIQSKIKDSSLQFEDLVNTDLSSLAEVFNDSVNIEYDSFADLFADLTHFPNHLSEDFYCLFDDVSWDCEPEFFASESEVQDRFKDKYCGGQIAWENMGLDELEDWLSRSQDDLSEFPYNTFYDEIE